MHDDVSDEQYLKDKIDTWFCEVRDSLDDREITDLAYEARDLMDVAGALDELAQELWNMRHYLGATLTKRAATAVQQAADTIGDIDG